MKTLSLTPAALLVALAGTVLGQSTDPFPAQFHGANIEVNTAWYKQYDSCHDPDVDGGPGALPISPVGSQLTSNLPGTTAMGTLACWMVTIDFSGTTDEFTLPADGNGNFDNIVGVEELDDIGFSMRLRMSGDNPLPPNVPGAATGFILSGDPLNEPHGSGTNLVWGFPLGIDPAIGTGLHEEDRFYIEDTPPSLPGGNGCYFFGGYTLGNPWAGLYHEIFGDDVVLGTNYCTAETTLFSSGTTSGISASGSSSITANDLVITASGLPNAPNQPGIFIAGPESALIPLYCGNLCISFNGLQRFVTAAGSTGGVITENIDYATSAAGGLNVMAGMVMNYQRWNRDPSTAAQAACNGTGMGSPSPTANFSDAIAIMHTP